MSFSDGLAAINLQMPPKVPRTEYSADFHWELINTVTGMQVDQNSSSQQRLDASLAFRKAWDYSLWWNVLIGADFLGDFRTRMGHAEYAAGGVDFDNKLYCPFKDVDEALAFDPWEQYGEIDIKKATALFEQNYAYMRSLSDNELHMTGTYITLVSGLVEIFGWELLLEACGTDRARFGQITDSYAKWIQQYFVALAESDVPLVMIHDDMVWSSGAIFHPDFYKKHVFANYKKLFTPLIDSGKKILFTSDGNYTQFIDDIASCGVHGFVLEPLTDMEYMANKYGKTHVIVGNTDTRILLKGNKEEIRAEVKRCMDIGKSCPGFIMAVGNHIPPNTPVESCLYYDEVYRELSKR